ncbi:hypothetical protein DLM75_18775 [Leptospira stimsonii]|uniref:Uncharacterized protein n=1 Tax=Leptospira stimsonii TaxID=2202203 RepID=A0A396YUV4_9LEPT|nr:hypothetical protein DLM75_18775 [Leptospira stimsonii]
MKNFVFSRGSYFLASSERFSPLRCDLRSLFLIVNHDLTSEISSWEKKEKRFRVYNLTGKL